MGPPGSGKGTQAARVADYLGVTWVSSGDLFREHQQRDTEMGRLARSYMERGVYVPDSVTIRMILDWINSPEQSKGFVLDGFPRTLPQARALDRELGERSGIDMVLYIDVSRDELTRRLGGRLVCRDCQAPHRKNPSHPDTPGACQQCGGELYQRDDDKPEIIEKRIQVYMDETEPVVRHYGDAGKLWEVEGEGSIEEVGKRLRAAVGQERRPQAD